MIDLFGRRQIAALRQELNEKNREIDILNGKILGMVEESKRHDLFYIKELESRFKSQRELETQNARFSNAVGKSDEVRKDLARKLHEAQVANERQDSRYKALLADYSAVVDSFEATKKELDELYQTHEDLLKEAAYKKEQTICEEEVKTA